MSRFFNTEGVVDPARHYCVDPLARIDLPRVLELIDHQKYFVLHAPRQTGKTTLPKALVAYLTEKGRHRACYINVELAQAARDNLQEAFLTINRRLVTDARESGEPRLEPLLGPLNAESGATAAFGELLIRWAQMDPRPLVLFFDEVDALVGDTLIALLRALRAGYDKRPRSFPASAVLCGVRDVRDYRLFSSAEKTVVTGGRTLLPEEEEAQGQVLHCLGSVALKKRVALATPMAVRHEVLLLDQTTAGPRPTSTRPRKPGSWTSSPRSMG